MQPHLRAHSSLAAHVLKLDLFDITPTVFTELYIAGVSADLEQAL